MNKVLKDRRWRLMLTKFLKIIGGREARHHKEVPQIRIARKKLLEQLAFDGR